MSTDQQLVERSFIECSAAVGIAYVWIARPRHDNKNRIVDGQGAVIDDTFDGGKPAAIVPGAGVRPGTDQGDDGSAKENNDQGPGFAGSEHAPP